MKYFLQKNKSLEKKRIDEKHVNKIQGKTEIKEKLKQGQMPFKKKKSVCQLKFLIYNFILLLIVFRCRES